MKLGEECPLQGRKADQDRVSLGGLVGSHSSKPRSSLGDSCMSHVPRGRAGAGQEMGHLRRRVELTKMSPFRSSPGSMVIQMLAWLSPGMLLRERQGDEGACSGGSRLPPFSPAPVLTHTDYLLNARCVHGLHGLVDAEKRSAPCQRRRGG